MNTLIVECSKCNLIMGSKLGQLDQTGKNISHSICPNCLPTVYGTDFTKEEIEQFVIKGRDSQRKLKMKLWYKLINSIRKIKFRFQQSTPVEV